MNNDGSWLRCGRRAYPAAGSGHARVDAARGAAASVVRVAELAPEQADVAATPGRPAVAFRSRMAVARKGD